MAHQLQLEKTKYRQWAKAGLGLGYLKDGLAPFCQEIATQQQRDLLHKIQRQKSLSLPLTCGACHLRTLQPDHKKGGNKVCPFGQINCNCWFPNGKNACPNNICGAIYDGIINSHASNPPAPNWKNTDSMMWTSNPWSIAKCFINAPGYLNKTSAAETDITGLCHLIINNTYFQSHISCSLTGANIFSKVRDHRNTIFHSSSQEVEETTANSYIDDMITVLQDPKELVTNPDAQQAVLNLQDLKNKDFIITSESLEKLLKQLREDLMHELNELKSTVSTKEEVEELERKISNIEGLLKQTREDLMLELNNLKSTVSTKDEVEELERKISNIKDLLKGTKDEIAKSAESSKELLKQTDEKYEGLKRNIDMLMSNQEEIKKRQRVEDSPDEKKLKYEKTKSVWRNNMIQEYRDTVLKVPAMPVLSDEECQFSTIYVRPKIVSEVKDKHREIKEIEIESLSEIFTKNGVPLKSVYVVGDAGTGKSSFCNYLVNCWCMAHSEGQIVEDEFEGVEEMKKFEFLFLVSLRHNQGKDSIYEMLKNQYNIDILDTLLEKESEKMIILIDGLDEWSYEGKTYCQFQTMGLPKRDVYKKYTIVTTSRPWKIHTLRIRNKEIQQMLKLKGFDDERETEMVERTVSNLNSTKNKNKGSADCQRKLGETALSNLKQVPIMLQQLICLWFDGKIDKTSRCAVYTEMLELFFTWDDDKTEGKSFGLIEATQTVELPECFADKVMCDSNTSLIYDLSLLAYETLFNCPKDKSLTFDNAIFRKLKISDKTRESCLKLGILTNDKCPSVSVSTRPKSMFSFIHKSVQEFLAAVNIAINYKTRKDSSNNSGKTEVQRDCIQFVQEVFQKCSTVNEILEQSNVIIMLCGLEPRLATHVSRYIYNIVNEDKLVQRYRRTVDSDIREYSSDYSCIRYIQNLIFNSMKECNASTVENRPTFHIGDLSIVSHRYLFFDDDFCDIVCSSIDLQQVKPDSVRSIYEDDINTENVKFSKYLPKFKHLEKIIINYATQVLFSTESVDTMIDEVNKSVAETIKINTSTLKSLSLNGSYNEKLYSLCKNVVHLLPSMNNLVAIKMTSIKMSHHDTSRICEFLKGTSHLEQIHIGIDCECGNNHDVDLSKHQKLQYLDLGNRMCITDIDTVNLEVLKCCNIKSTNYVKIFDSIMKCEKLKKLDLRLDINDKSVSFHTSIRDRLVSELPLLHNLSKLNLLNFRLTDNIIQNPSEMKSLKDITLGSVRMSLTTWKKFVDSLTSIPHTVDVRLFSCYITGDGVEFNYDRLSYRLEEGVVEKRNEAIQYVKDKKQLFNVGSDDDVFPFSFSTIK